MSRMKIIHVAGARPNFMKIAPILKELSLYSDVTSLLVHTGQHYDPNMSDVFFTDLKLPRPDINLEVGSGSHAEQTAQVMLRFEPVILQEKPDLVVVVGDVNSTLACSLVAAKLHIPIAHVEAGLRSFDNTMPEEINRVVTDVLSDYLFTPSRYADKNLQNQGVQKDKIFFVGNVMVDSLLGALEIARQRQTWSQWGYAPGDYAVLTLHRASNVDDIEILSDLVGTVIEAASRLPILFPVHPRTLRQLDTAGILMAMRNTPGLILTEPLGYLDFLCLLGDARLALTDSGGIQAETTMLGVPCLTLRWNTEWPETVLQGTNHLVGTDRQPILSEFQAILDAGNRPATRPELWDGLAAHRIVEILCR